jgi:menaquinone-dependent protoporphyrinogen IX oxidase
VHETKTVSGYDAVIVGAPITSGFHVTALEFLQRNQSALSHVPVAYFITCLKLMKLPDMSSVPLFVDPKLPQTPKNPNKLGWLEKFATTQSYVGPVLEKVPQIKPIQVAFFGGKIEASKMNPLTRWMFGLWLGLKPNQDDYRHWDVIEQWAGDIYTRL